MSFLDVECEFSSAQLARVPDPTRAIAETCHEVATAAAERQGRRLAGSEPIRTDGLVSRRAVHPLTGADVLLVATRWELAP